MADVDQAEVDLSAHGLASSGESSPARRVRLRWVSVVALAAIVASFGSRWMNSLPVPLNAENGTYGSPFDVGTSIHLGVFPPEAADLDLERADARLLPGSAPASVGVSVCHRPEGRGAIGSASGPLPAGTCEPLAPFDGQRLRQDDYLLVSVVALSPGTVRLELVVTARDGLRRGSKVVELPQIPME